jgi:hypothetical protein
MLKPQQAARLAAVAQESPQQREASAGTGEPELVLPRTPEMFRGMSSRQITGVHSRHRHTNGGPARFVLNRNRALTLTDGTLLPVPRPEHRRQRGGWVLTPDGSNTTSPVSTSC